MVKRQLSSDEVFEKLRGVLVDALGVDEEEVVPTATLRADLGAESIDFLDLAFRLEKEFHGLKVSRGQGGMPEIVEVSSVGCNESQLRLAPDLTVQELLDRLKRKLSEFGYTIT